MTVISCSFNVIMLDPIALSQKLPALAQFIGWKVIFIFANGSFMYQQCIRQRFVKQCLELV